MVDPEDEIRRVREEAQRLRQEAREAARVAREEGNRLRREARELQHRMRREARMGAAEARAGEGGQTAEAGLPLEGVRHVIINQTAGTLVIRPAREGETPGVSTSSPRSAPKLTVRREGDRLHIDIELAKGWLFRRKQGANSVVRLQGSYEGVRAEVGWGDLQVRDLTAETIRMDAGAGTITGYSTRGTIRAEVGAGRIALNVHNGLATCHTGTGDVMLDVAEVAPGEYNVNVGMGRVEVRLPEGTGVHVEASSGIGKTTNRYGGGAEGAQTTLRVSSGIGEVIVRARDAAAEPTGPAPASGTGRPAGRAPGRRYEAEEMRILQLLEQGRISSQEAAELIAALQGAAPPPEDEDEEPGLQSGGDNAR